MHRGDACRRKPQARHTGSDCCCRIDAPDGYRQTCLPSRNQKGTSRLRFRADSDCGQPSTARGIAVLFKRMNAALGNHRLLDYLHATPAFPLPTAFALSGTQRWNDHGRSANPFDWCAVIGAVSSWLATPIPAVWLASMLRDFWNTERNRRAGWSRARTRFCQPLLYVSF